MAAAYTPSQQPQLMAGVRSGPSHSMLSCGSQCHAGQSLLLEGSPYAEIVRVARAERFDLNVMAGHGRAGIVRALLGSVAECVLRKAHCPVLAIRHPDPRIEHP